MVFKGNFIALEFRVVVVVVVVTGVMKCFSWQAVKINLLQRMLPSDRQEKGQRAYPFKK